MKNLFVLLFTLLVGATFLLAPSPAFAQDKVLEGINSVKGPFPETVVSSDNPKQLLVRIIELGLYIGAMLAVVFIIVGGYQYVTSAGSEDAAKKGRRTLVYAVIGLVIIILAYVIVQTVYNFLTKTT